MYYVDWTPLRFSQFDLPAALPWCCLVVFSRPGSAAPILPRWAGAPADQSTYRTPIYAVPILELRHLTQPTEAINCDLCPIQSVQSDYYRLDRSVDQSWWLSTHPIRVLTVQKSANCKFLFLVQRKFPNQLLADISSRFSLSLAITETPSNCQEIFSVDSDQPTHQRTNSDIQNRYQLLKKKPQARNLKF